jgi:hypothetical protein
MTSSEGTNVSPLDGSGSGRAGGITSSSAEDENCRNTLPLCTFIEGKVVAVVMVLGRVERRGVKVGPLEARRTQARASMVAGRGSNMLWRLWFGEWESSG